jgi:predicted nucleic acid-binding protein
VILVDTSVWIEHFRQGDAVLAQLLNDGRVLMHPFIIGELALGGLADRKSVLLSLNDLPRSETAMDHEVLRFIETQALFGSGIGYIDAHLLTSVRLTPGTALWTRDKRLEAAAARLRLAAQR